MTEFINVYFILHYIKMISLNYQFSLASNYYLQFTMQYNEIINLNRCLWYRRKCFMVNTYNLHSYKKIEGII